VVLAMVLPALNTSAAWVAIVLAAGYGTRFEAGLESKPELRDLLGTPKGLLPCGQVPLLDHWLYKFRTEAQDLVGNVVVVTNECFKGQFRQWARKRGIPGENVLGDGTYTNAGRLGAVKDLELVVREKEKLLQNKKVIIMASDLLFYEDFNLRSFLESTAMRGTGACLFYNITDKELSKRGIVEVNEDGKVVSFLEKPSSAWSTSSRKACPPLYAMKNNSDLLSLLQRFLYQNDKATDKEATDAPGKFWSWLVEQEDVSIYSEEVNGRFDVGDVEDYLETKAYFDGKVNATMSQQLFMKDDSDERLSLEWKLMAILSTVFVGAMSIRTFLQRDTRTDADAETLTL